MPPNPPTPPPPHNAVPACARSGAWGLLLPTLFLLIALPLILFMGARGRPGEDQINYHQPAIHTFAQALPAPDLRDYLSATTPGYHLVLACVERFVSGDARVLQLAGAMFSVLLLLVFSRTVMRLADSRAVEGLVLCLPLACSMYVLQAGVWLLPDNAGWLMVMLCLALALRTPFTLRTVALGAAALVGVVLMRQVHLWVAGALFAAAWLAPGIAEPGSVGQLFSRFPARVKALAPMVLAALPAFGVLAWFYSLWGGLTPPTFQGQYAEVSLAAFPFLLSLLGIISLFHVAYLADPVADLSRGRVRTAVALGALAGALVAVIPDTTYSVPNRSSGLWNLVKLVPSIVGHTSPVLVAGSALGGAMLALWWHAVPARPRWILLGSLFGFASAQAISGQVWQRYNEPMALIVVALFAACARPSGAAPALTRRLLAPARLAGVGVLAVLLAGLSAFTISRFGPAATYDIRLINPDRDTHTPPPADATP